MKSPFRTTKWIGLGCLLFAGFSITGCKESDMGEVTGIVTVDGQPPDSGSIAFFPVDGKSSTTGTTIREGKYSAQVPFGKNRVEIRVSKVVGEKKLYDTPDSPVQPIMQEVLPAKYNDDSKLTLEVRQGKNTKDFDLETK